MFMDRLMPIVHSREHNFEHQTLLPLLIPLLYLGSDELFSCSNIFSIYLHSTNTLLPYANFEPFFYRVQASAVRLYYLIHTARARPDRHRHRHRPETLLQVRRGKETRK